VLKPRRMRWAEHVARMGQRRVTYEGLMDRPERKSATRSPRHGWDYDIKMDIQDVGWRLGFN